MQKFFFSFVLVLLIIITSIAYLGNINQVHLNEYAIKITSTRHNSYEDENEENTTAATTNTVTEAKKTIELANMEPFNYVKRYPFLRECDAQMSSNLGPGNGSKYDYSQPAANITHEKRVIKALLVYFPVELSDNFELEFKWLYRSWIEMIKHEPRRWRTDLLVFVLNDQSYFNRSDFFFNQLNCSFLNRRQSNQDPPMCTLVEYTPIRMRKFNLTSNTIPYFVDTNAKYEFFLNELDIFDDGDDKSNTNETSKTNMKIFYSFIQDKLSNYGYVDSILMAFDGYSYLSKAGYHYLIRSDMDVFLTPLFSKWLPRNCSDFYVGRGGYSSAFNVNRLRRISTDLGLSYASKTNLGSTWYATPHQFRLVAYLTLFGMAYMSDEEFTPPEREGKLGVALWPYWHYGVLLLYGQNVFMNHLIASGQLDIVKLTDQLDYPAYYSDTIDRMLHIHVFHGDAMFSKFQFKAGKYDAIDYDQYDVRQAKYYALKMALDARRAQANQLYQFFSKVIAYKN